MSDDYFINGSPRFFSNVTCDSCKKRKATTIYPDVVPAHLSDYICKRCAEKRRRKVSKKLDAITRRRMKGVLIPWRG